MVGNKEKLMFFKIRNMLLFPVSILAFFSSTVVSYAPVHNSDLNHGDMTGIWRLTNKRSFLPSVQEKQNSLVQKSALKEFTVYPKRKSKIILRQPNHSEETFIKLSENGSFEQFATLNTGDEGDDEDDQNNDVNKNSSSNAGSILGLSLMSGTWDYIDGKLILATDRPSDCADIRKVHDTILEGIVVATSEKSLVDNPVLSDKKNSNQTSHLLPNKNELSDTFDPNVDIHSEKSKLDVHLSVPKGSVQVGRFMYPKRHPSFFEQPIFQPTPAGSFELRQVLGLLNTRNLSNEEEIERFKREDFYGKKFFLTSRPLQYKPKGKMRWNRSLGHYVEERSKVDPNENIDIRVMKIELFPNNTFSTVDGGIMSEKTKILRGRWDVIGRDKDQLWLQVSRFGFGRSVAGSIYSEGNQLTQDDQRSYWGSIEEIVYENRIIKENDEEIPDKILQTSFSAAWNAETPALQKKTFEIKGSVLFGWGLEPEPIGKFTMVEQTEDDDDEYDEDSDDDEDDENKFESIFE